MFLLMVLMRLATGSVDPNKAAICLSVAKFRFDQERDFVRRSIQTPGISYEDVFGKLVTSATLYCYDNIQFSDYLHALDPQNAQFLSPRMKELTPIPSEIMCGLEDIELTTSEKGSFSELVDIVKGEYRRKDNRGEQQI